MTFVAHPISLGIIGQLSYSTIYFGSERDSQKIGWKLWVGEVTLEELCHDKLGTTRKAVPVNAQSGDMLVNQTSEAPMTR